MNEVSLKRLSIRISSGLTPLRSNVNYWNSPDIPWVKTEQLGTKNIFDSNEKVSLQALDETGLRIYPKNTISIAMYGEGKTRGSVSILKKEMTTNQACCNIELDENKADYEYVYYYLTTQYNQLRNLSSGVRKNLNANDIKSFKIRIPDKIADQQRIASVLSALDAKIELNNRINRELEAMAKTLYDYWFVQFDFPITREQAMAMGKPELAGKPYKRSGGPMVYHPALKREIPEGWEAGTMDKLGTIIGGSTPSKAKVEHFCQGNGTPWITPKDLSLNKGSKFITRGEYDVTDSGIKDASLSLMPKGTILLSSRAPIGYLAISRDVVTTNQGFKSFVPDKGFSTEFVYYSVKNMISAIEKNAVGSTFKEVSGSTLKTIVISLPPSKLVDFFNAKAKCIFHKQDLLEFENQQLASLRDWLLPMLMNGQVRVKEAGEMAHGLGLEAEVETGCGM